MYKQKKSDRRRHYDYRTSASQQTQNKCNCFYLALSPEKITQVLQNNTYENIAIFLDAIKGVIPSVHSRYLKQVIQDIIPNHAQIETLKLIEQGK